MFFTLKEIVKWLGMTAFEIWMQLLTVLVYSVLAFLRQEEIVSWSWWTVSIPLFLCDGLSAYFCIILFIRMYSDSDLGFRSAGLRLLSSILCIVLQFVFKILLCQKLSGARIISNSEVMAPLFILLQICMFRACQVH